MHPSFVAVPQGVFQIRSRHDVHKCVGPKVAIHHRCWAFAVVTLTDGCLPSQVPKEEEEDVKYGIPQQKFADGAPLQLQKCNLGTLVQLWYFDKKMQLHSLKDPTSVRLLTSFAHYARRTALTFLDSGPHHSGGRSQRGATSWQATQRGRRRCGEALRGRLPHPQLGPEVHQGWHAGPQEDRVLHLDGVAAFFFV